MIKKETITSFKYSGKNARGRKVRGEISDKSISLAKLALKKQGITTTSISPKSSFSLGSKAIKPMDIALLARQLATMMKSGISIIEAFEVVIDGQSHQALKTLTITIKNDIESGATFAEALSKHPLYFDSLFCSLIAAGEKSGALDKMLDRIANYKEKGELLKLKIKKAMKYPITVIAASVIVTVILMLKVIPVFSDLFASFGSDLPAFTQMVVDASEFTKQYWLFGLVIVVVAVFLLKRASQRSIAFQHTMQRISLRLPIFGDIVLKAIIARYSQTLATVFAAGVPLIDALDSAAKATGNIVYEETILDIREDVMTGQTLDFAMRSSCMFPAMAVQLTSIGEESGDLEGMLDKVALFYENEVDNAVDGLTSMLEPLVMVILGVLVGGLVVAMYLPIFQMGAVI